MLLFLLASLVAADSLDPNFPLCVESLPSAVPFDLETVPQHCPGSTSATLEEAAANAYVFAPIIYYHPLEEYSPDSVDHWLETATLFDPNRNQLGPYTPQLLESIVAREDRGDGFYFQHLDNNHEGAGFNETTGESLAPIYFKVVAENGTLVFNYYVFHAMNWCANQDILLQEGGKQYLMAYYACDMAIHEGDWEHVGVQVCPDMSRVLRVTYSQHGWNQERNCRIGDCRLENGTHPIGYSGLNSHATYPVEAHSNVYWQSKDPSNGFTSVRTLTIADRTRRDEVRNRRFWPRPDNVINIGDNTTAPTWSFFFGAFGRAQLTAPNPIRGLTCLNWNTDAFRDCGGDALSGLVVSLLKQLASSSSFIAGLVHLDTNGVPGPWANDKKWNGWFVSTPTPLLAEGATATCPDPSRLSSISDLSKLFVNTVGVSVVVAATVLTLVGIVTLTVWHFIFHKQQLQEGMKNRNIADTLLKKIFPRLPKAVLFSALCTIIGNLVMWIGLRELLSVLQVYIISDAWFRMRAFFSVLSPLSMALSVFTVVHAFIATGSFLAKQVQKKPHIVLSVRRAQRRVEIVLFFSVILAFLLSLASFSVGSISQFFHMVFERACANTETDLASVCLTLDTFNLPAVYCGLSLNQFCADFARTHPEMVLIGSAMMFIGQLVYMWSSGENFSKFRKKYGRHLYQPPAEDLVPFTVRFKRALAKFGAIFGVPSDAAESATPTPAPETPGLADKPDEVFDDTDSDDSGSEGDSKDGAEASPPAGTQPGDTELKPISSSP